MPLNERYDVVVMGAGLAGMIAMARFAASGLRVLGLEKQDERPLDPSDLRSTAILMPSIEVLENAGIWGQLRPLATPLDVMEIVDAAQNPPKSVRFASSEIDEAHFGYNLMNAQLHGALRDIIDHHPRIEVRYGVEVSALMQFDKEIALRLEDQELRTRLLVGADGRQSNARALLGIDAEIRPFDQMAQVFTVTHDAPHHNVSTEVHEQGGPFTLVPRADIDGQHASAVVWMDKPEAVEARTQMSAEEFNAALNARSHGVRGQLTRVSGLGAFPMVTLEAESFANHRGVLIGEAAHVVPPIGAQGLNMSLRDIESLVRVLERGGIEHPKYLQNWARTRRMDVTMRKNGIRMLNNISIGSMSRAEAMRRMGLDVLDKKTPLKTGLMRLGLGR